MVDRYFLENYNYGGRLRKGSIAVDASGIAPERRIPGPDRIVQDQCSRPNREQ